MKWSRIFGIVGIKQKLTFCKHVALHCATRKGDETSSSANTPIHDIETENK